MMLIEFDKGNNADLGAGILCKLQILSNVQSKITTTTREHSLTHEQLRRQ